MASGKEQEGASWDDGKVPDLDHDLFGGSHTSVYTGKNSLSNFSVLLHLD